MGLSAMPQMIWHCLLQRNLQQDLGLHAGVVPVSVLMFTAMQVGFTVILSYFF